MPAISYLFWPSISRRRVVELFLRLFFGGLQLTHLARHDSKVESADPPEFFCLANHQAWLVISGGYEVSAWCCGCAVDRILRKNAMASL